MASGRLPANIMSAPDGNMWFTEVMGNKVAKLDPATGQITEYSTGGYPGGIMLGPDNNLWFVALMSNTIGRIELAAQTPPSGGGSGSSVVPPVQQPNVSVPDAPKAGAASRGGYSATIIFIGTTLAFILVGTFVANKIRN